MYILWFINHADQNSAKVAEQNGVIKQLTQNAKDIAAWAEQSRDAEAQRRVDMQNVTAAVLQQRTPVLVRVPSSPGPVSNAPAQAGSCTPAAGGSDQGSGEQLVNVRSAINAFELKYEGYLAACRSVLNSWPQ